MAALNQKVPFTAVWDRVVETSVLRFQHPEVLIPGHHLEEPNYMPTATQEAPHHVTEMQTVQILEILLGHAAEI